MNKEAVSHFTNLKDLVAQTRQAVSLNLRQKSCLWLKNEDLLKERGKLIQRLTAVAEIEPLDPNKKQPGLLINQATGYEAWLSLRSAELKTALTNLAQEISDHQRKRDVFAKTTGQP